MSYSNLANFGWKPGIHRAPVGYEHRWLVVMPTITIGVWTRADARLLWKEWTQNGRY